MKVIYVAGKYRDGTSIGVIQNIFHATREAYKLWKDGWAVICPHMNTAHFKDLPHTLIMPGDIEMLKRCDAIYMLKNWKQSEGAKRELEVAIEKGLEVFYE